MEQAASNPDESADRCEEFLQHFARDRDRLSAYIYSLLPNRADAEDVFQRCSLLLWRKFSEFDEDRSFLAWACGVAFYEVRNFVRSADRDRLQFNTELMAQLSESRLKNLEHGRDLVPLLQECMALLGTRERELIRLVYEQKQNLRAWAEANGQVLQTIYNRLARVRKRLLECVQRKIAAE